MLTNDDLKSMGFTEAEIFLMFDRDQIIQRMAKRIVTYMKTELTKEERVKCVEYIVRELNGTL